jgi:8-amino-7-oxononanoate synthase
LGCHGAIVLGPKVLKQFLINFARSFIFTTALPLHTLLRIRAAYDLIPHHGRNKKKIQELCTLLSRSLILNNARLIPGPGPIQSLVIPGNERAKKVAEEIEKGGFYAKAILYPTVPRGQERIRICIHSFNTTEQVKQLADILNKSIA